MMGGLLGLLLLLGMVTLIMMPSGVAGLPADVADWAEGDVLMWLEDEEFGEEVVNTFRKYHVDGQRLLLLNQDDLEELLKVQVMNNLFILIPRLAV